MQERKEVRGEKERKEEKEENESESWTQPILLEISLLKEAHLF